MYRLPDAIRESCESILGRPIQNVSYVGGGDINETRLLETAKGFFFLKMNRKAEAARMFETEARGLKLLANSHSLRIPEVKGRGTTKSGAFLLLEYIDSGSRNNAFWENFGRLLAQLHRTSNDRYGLDEDNFIGSLPQYNTWTDNWIEFYIEKRLRPQLGMALDNNLMGRNDEKNFEILFKKLPSMLVRDQPALIHGDLWSGNFMTDKKSRPVLVDPAVCFAHREMDLAMSRLFGGFSSAFYAAYQEAFPLEQGLEERIEIYQLYYQMVHVNLFGGGYINSARSILGKYA